MLRRSIIACAFGLVILPGRADAQTVGVGVRGLPSVVRVGVPVPVDDVLVVSGSVGYGYLDRVAEQPPAGRGLGSLALAYSPLPELTFGADLNGRRDAFEDGVNLYGEPRVTARFVTGLSASQFLGVQLDARLIGAEAPSIKWQATSPALRALYAARLGRHTWLGAELGFELDQSDAAVPDWSRVSATDDRTLSASSWNNVPIGVGVVQNLSVSWQLVAELAGEWLIGQDSPALLQSPWRVSGGVRHQISRAWTLQAGIDVAVSKRDAVSATHTLPREPRVAGFVALAWALPYEVAPVPVSVKKLPQPKPVVVAAPPVAEPQAPPSAPVAGTLVDEGGRPIADAEVVLLRDGVEVGRERTTADGQFTFSDVALGAVVLRVKESGYDALDVSLGADQPRTAELVLRPAVPAGQVRGKVLDLQGNPIMAQVTVNPGELSSTATVDGSFELDLAPGRYTVRFEHPSFASQRRTIVVKDRGVVILNIGLVR